jgi:hypothetical protein
MNKVVNTIIKRIKAKRRGWVFAPADFLDIGNRAAVDKVLSRLTASGMIRRIGRGLYDFPKQHKMLGTLSPDADGIARAMGIKGGDAVYPSGAMAANILGLSTQVPAKPVYLTNGSSKSTIIGKQVVTLRHAKVPLLENAPSIVNLTFQALNYLGKRNIDDIVIQRFANVLNDKDVNYIYKSIAHIPSWMADVIHKIKQRQDGQIYKTSGYR